MHMNFADPKIKILRDFRSLKIMKPYVPIFVTRSVFYYDFEHLKL